MSPFKKAISQENTFPMNALIVYKNCYLDRMETIPHTLFPLHKILRTLTS